MYKKLKTLINTIIDGFKTGHKQWQTIHGICQNENAYACCGMPSHSITSSAK